MPVSIIASLQRADRVAVGEEMARPLFLAFDPTWNRSALVSFKEVYSQLKMIAAQSLGPAWAPQTQVKYARRLASYEA